MARVMFQFRSPGGPPTLDRVRAEYGLAEHEVDPTFGVIQTDRADHLYTVLVDDAASARIQSHLKHTQAGDPAIGVFSNPPIEPTGPTGRRDGKS